MKVWTTAARLVRTSKKMRAMANKEKKERNTNLTNALEDAEKRGDAAEQYRIMRLMGGTNRGPKKRKMNVPLADEPTAQEWAEHNKQKGVEGGCSAHNFIQDRCKRIQKE